MKLRILSDLHFEFHKDLGATFISGFSDPDYDVLVLAGDITSAQNIKNTFRLIKRAVGLRPVIYVPGNHEYYSSSPKVISRILEECKIENSRLHVLDDNVLVISGQRFVGSTLWFPHSGGFERGDDGLNDFNYIDGFRDWIGQKASASAKFLDENVEPGDVVITHHLPSFKSVHEVYKDSFLNKYFVHNVEPIVERGAKLWVHGHTHMSMDYKICDTRVVCNPFGYLRMEENSKFIEKFTLEI